MRWWVLLGRKLSLSKWKSTKQRRSCLGKLSFALHEVSFLLLAGSCHVGQGGLTLRIFGPLPSLVQESCATTASWKADNEVFWRNAHPMHFFKRWLLMQGVVRESQSWNSTLSLPNETHCLSTSSPQLIASQGTWVQSVAWSRRLCLPSLPNGLILHNYLLILFPVPPPIVYAVDWLFSCFAHGGCFTVTVALLESYGSSSS